MCFLLVYDPKEAAPASVLLSPRSLLKPPLVTNPELCFPALMLLRVASDLCRLLSPQVAPVCAFFTSWEF